jgi:phage terminase small subunit
MTKTREVINMALSDKHKRFADEYLIDMNATAAYLRAGYTARGNSAEVNASRLLRNPKVQEYIESKQQKKAEKLDLTAEWVLNNYKQIVEKCMQAEPVYDKATKEIIEYKFDSSGANKALEMIGKHLGMFKDKLEITAHLTVESMLEEL